MFHVSFSPHSSLRGPPSLRGTLHCPPCCLPLPTGLHLPTGSYLPTGPNLPTGLFLPTGSKPLLAQPFLLPHCFHTLSASTVTSPYSSRITTSLLFTHYNFLTAHTLQLPCCSHITTSLLFTHYNFLTAHTLSLPYCSHRLTFHFYRSLPTALDDYHVVT